MVVIDTISTEKDSFFHQKQLYGIIAKAFRPSECRMIATVESDNRIILAMLQQMHHCTWVSSRCVFDLIFLCIHTKFEKLEHTG